MKILRFFSEAALEVLWPTRCAICDITGERLICKECANKLLAIDSCLACPRCGAPFGAIQCTECNDEALHLRGVDTLPFESMSHAYILDDAARKVVCAYKDQDERRLSTFIAKAIMDCIGPELFAKGYHLTFIPDSRDAYRRRGFDHSEEIASKASALTGMKCDKLFLRPSSTDQRNLGKYARIENMAKVMKVRKEALVPNRVLVIDDVCTTGATIYAACAELKRCGAEHISAATFGQVLS